MAARYCIDQLLAAEPNNRQALTLKALIRDRIARDGAVGLTVVAGAAVGAGALLALLVKRARR